MERSLGCLVEQDSLTLVSPGDRIGPGQSGESHPPWASDPIQINEMSVFVKERLACSLERAIQRNDLSLDAVVHEW